MRISLRPRWSLLVGWEVGAVIFSFFAFVRPRTVALTPPPPPPPPTPPPTGMAYWSAFYPADTVKTEMQTRDAGSGASKSFFSTFRDIYRTSGVRGLYRGLTPTVSCGWGELVPLFDDRD